MGRIGTYTATTARPISEKQLSWLTSLTTEFWTLTGKITDTDVSAQSDDAVARLSDLTTRTASDEIDRLRDLLPTLRRTAAYTAQTVEQPASVSELDRTVLYWLDGNIYRLRKAGPTARRKGEVYALVLNTVTRKYDYAGYDVAARLTPADKMNTDQAKEFGDTFAFCARCSADLSDPVSIAQGMGPVCIKYQR